MPRILLFVLLVFLVWLAVRWLGGLRKPGARGSDSTRDATRDASQRAGSQARQEVEPMRQCAWCGAHVPARDALLLPDGRVYCDAVHRDAARDAAHDAAGDAVVTTESRRRE